MCFATKITIKKEPVKSSKNGDAEPISLPPQKSYGRRPIRTLDQEPETKKFKPEPETTSRSSPLHHYNKSPDAFYKSPVDNSNYDSLTPKYTPKVLLLEMIYIYIVLFFIFLKFQI